MNCSQSDAEGADPREREIAASLESANPGEFADQAVSETCSQAGGERDGEAPGWRDEVAERLGRYRARRKPRPPRYPSLRLRFEPEESFRDFTSSSGGTFAEPPPAAENTSYRGLALDASTATEMATARGEGAATQSLLRGAATSSSAPLPRQSDSGQPRSGQPRSGQPSSGQSSSGAKIIEFPRPATSELSPPVDELAEPVIERPRILEAPEIAPAPALGGITIDAGEQKEIERRPGIDFPLQSAPLARRVGAGVVDGALVLVASALFAFIFWKITGVQPPRVQVLGLAAGIPCLLWTAYQFLLIVYSGRTPGLWLAGLEITHFDGTRPSRHRRRWRVVASYLSAISLGMGYAWVFLDEDALCWHDRITHTYLAPKRRQS